MTNRARLSLIALVLAALAGAAALTGESASAAFAGDARGAAAPPPAPDDQYVGAKRCAECHAEKFVQFSATPHSKLVTDEHTRVSDRGCEACHGPGLEHSKLAKQLADEAAQTGKAPAPPADWRIFQPKRASAEEVAARCTRCHEEQSVRNSPYHMEHDLKAVSCNDCHSPHQEKTNPWILRDNAPGLCYQCHAEVAADFRKPFHHKVDEGGISCLDCHNAHGPGNTAEARRSPEGLAGLCGRCHADKRGPWAFEHLGLTRSGDACLECHTPHGSVNNRLLVRNTVFQVCIQCHSEIGLTADTNIGGNKFPHDLSNPRFRECTVCHTQIHGSNSHDKFLY